MPEARKTTPAVRRFGGFELNPRTGELRKGGVRVSVPEQPLKVLDRLLERPGELVTREELRQRLWAGDTFVDFEHGLNAAVKRLREALGDSAENPRFVETLPRRGYRFIAILEEDGTRSEVGDVASIQIPRDQDERPLQTPRKSSGWLKRRPGWLVGAGLAGIAIASFGAWQIRQTPAAPPTIVPLTLLAGLEFSPTFSPDGTQVAFGWNGPSSGDFDRGFDIYVKMVGSADVRPLLIHPGSDGFPRWSPDGREIAYLRRDAVRQVWHVRVMSALGGAAREVSDIPVMPGISWSPDGRYIVAAGAAPHSGIHLLSVKDGERRVILQPSGSATVGWPAIAPNGRVLAYASCEEPVFNTNCYVQTVGLDTAFGLQDEPRRLTRQFAWRIRGVTTTHDGQDVIYQIEQPPTSTLWRVGIDGTRPPQRIEVAGITSWSPALAPSGNRLAFSRLVQDEDVYRLTPDGSSQPAPGHRPSTAIHRSRLTGGSLSARPARSKPWRSG